MITASEICTISNPWLYFIKIFMPVVAIQAEDTASEMACPTCTRVYGTLPTYPELTARRTIVRCTCGKYHLGYKPFRGYQ